MKTDHIVNDRCIAGRRRWTRLRDTEHSSARLRHINHSNRWRRAPVPRFYAYRNCSLANCCAPPSPTSPYTTVEAAPDRSKPGSKLSYRSSEQKAHAAEILKVMKSQRQRRTCCRITIIDVTMLLLWPDITTDNWQPQDIAISLCVAFESTRPITRWASYHAQSAEYCRAQIGGKANCMFPREML